MNTTFQSQLQDLIFVLIAIIIFSLLSSPLMAEEAAKENAKPIPFKIKAKVRQEGKTFYFYIPHPVAGSKVEHIVLPDDPRILCAKLSNKGAAMIKDREGLSIGRYEAIGTCIRTDGKIGSKVAYKLLTLTKLLPLGDGMIKDEVRQFTGTLKVLGDPNHKDWLKKSSMRVMTADKVEYRIPAKKFKEKPDGFSYQDAARLNGMKITMKAKVQIFRQMPYRIATVMSFKKAK